jgi:hypothetical protein
MARLLRALSFVLLGLHAAHAPGADALARVSNERGVKVVVTPLDLSPAGVDTLEFRVVMDTHAVELKYELTKIALLRDDRGNTYRPTAWQGPSGGHHVSGVLRFAQGREVMKARPAYLELQLEGVAGVPRRTFRWDSSAFK